MEIDKLKIKKIIIISLLSIIAIWWIYTRYLISDEAKIRKTIRTVQKAFKEMDINTIMKYVSRDYRDREGYTRREIFQYLFRYEKIYDRIEVKVFTIDIDIFNETGNKVALLTVSATVNAYARGNREIMLFKEQSERYELKFKLRKEGNTWKVIEYLDYKPI